MILPWIATVAVPMAVVFIQTRSNRALKSSNKDDHAMVIAELRETRSVAGAANRAARRTELKVEGLRGEFNAYVDEHTKAHEVINDRIQSR